MKYLLGFAFLLLLIPLESSAQKDIDPNGYNVIYYPNGSVLSEGYMKDGKPEGYWKTYYTTGVLKSEGNRKNFLLDSLWIFYNSTGDTLKKINYLLGKKNGYYYEYYTDRDRPEHIGNVRSKELYVNDKLQGISHYYYPDGSLKETITFSNNERDGLALQYAEDDGRIITIKRYNKGSLAERERINRYDQDGQKTGEWREFYEGLKVSVERNYRNDKLHGYYKEYNTQGTLVLTLLYDDGKLVEDVQTDTREIVVIEKESKDGQYTDRGPYVDDVPVGIHKRFDKNGEVIESWVYDDLGNLLSEGVIDREGNKQGDWKDYYRNGMIKAQGKFRNNLRDGKWSFYYESGNLEQEGNYDLGKENGAWRWYYPDGQILIEENYYNGRLEGLYTEYDELGNILTEGEYFDGEKEGNWIISINDFLAKGKYITGLEDGKWRYYYDDGTLMFEGSYIQGLPDGKHKYFYPDGSLKEERVYSSGVPDRHWKKYDREGNLIVTISYENGKEYRINGVKVDLPHDDVVIIN